MEVKKLLKRICGCDHVWKTKVQADFIPRDTRAAGGVIILAIQRCEKCGELTAAIVTLGTEFYMTEAEGVNDERSVGV